MSTVSFITASTTAAAAPAIAKGAKGRTKGLEEVSAPVQAWMEKNVEEMVENAKDQREQKVDKLGKSSRYGGAQAAGSVSYTHRVGGNLHGLITDSLAVR